jgi:putative ABC transport system substrate-binding protein
VARLLIALGFVAMKRREFVGFLGGAAVWPLAAHAQEARKLRRVGFLWDSPAVYGNAIAAFRDGLRELGWIEGQNIAIEARWAEGRPERMREYAEELVRLKVDIIVAPSSIYTEAARQATSTIPIIFMSHAEPIGSGHVVSLARPGGNITGLASMMPETIVKLLELLTEAIPGLSRVAVIWDPATPSHGPGRNAAEVAGAALKLQLQTLAVRAASEYDGAFAAISRNHADAVLVLPTPLYLPISSSAVFHFPSRFSPSP